MAYQNLGNAAKTQLRQKFIALNTYNRKQENLKTNVLMLPSQSEKFTTNLINQKYKKKILKVRTKINKGGSKLKENQQSKFGSLKILIQLKSSLYD